MYIYLKKQYIVLQYSHMTVHGNSIAGSLTRHQHHVRTNATKEGGQYRWQGWCNTRAVNNKENRHEKDKEKHFNRSDFYLFNSFGILLVGVLPSTTAATSERATWSSPPGRVKVSRYLWWCISEEGGCSHSSWGRHSGTCRFFIDQLVLNTALFLDGRLDGSTNSKCGSRTTSLVRVRICGASYRSWNLFLDPNLLVPCFERGARPSAHLSSRVATLPTGHGGVQSPSHFPSIFGIQHGFLWWF